MKNENKVLSAVKNVAAVTVAAPAIAIDGVDTIVKYGLGVPQGILKASAAISSVPSRVLFLAGKESGLIGKVLTYTTGGVLALPSAALSIASETVGVVKDTVRLALAIVQLPFNGLYKELLVKDKAKYKKAYALMSEYLEETFEDADSSEKMLALLLKGYCKSTYIACEGDVFEDENEEEFNYNFVSKLVDNVTKNSKFKKMAKEEIRETVYYIFDKDMDEEKEDII